MAGEYTPKVFTNIINGKHVQRIAYRPSDAIKFQYDGWSELSDADAKKAVAAAERDVQAAEQATAAADKATAAEAKTAAAAAKK